MAKLHELVADLVKLAGGELTGRVRLQKIVYLLDQKGLGSGAGYIYYHYGPYSEDLWDAVSDAKLFEELREETTVSPDGWATPYSVFKLNDPRKRPDVLGGLPADEASSLLAKLRGVNSTVLELAATVHWLACVERVPNWRTEIELRKAGKTGQGRLDGAVELLKDLGLAPTTN